MSRGRRYNNEHKLNMKKVFAVIIFIVVVIMFVFIIKKLTTKEKTDTTGKISSLNYFTVYTGEKWGVIDSQGKMVIDATYDEMIVVPDKTKDVFLCTYDVDYNNNTYKTKALNSKNLQIFSEYDNIEPIYNKDKNDNLYYEEGVLRVSKDNKYGLINYSGKLLLKCEYDNIEAMENITNSLIITQNGKVGLCNNEGSIIIEPKFEKIMSIGDTFKNGYIVVDENEKYGVIDFNKQVILENKYNEIESIAGNGKYVVNDNGEIQLVNKTGEVILTDGFDEIISINDNELTIKKNNKYGVIDVEGKEKIECIYDDIKFASSNNYIVKKGNLYGVVSSEGKQGLDIEYTSIIYRKEAKFYETEKEDEVETSIYNDNLELKLSGIISEVNNKKGYIRIRESGTYKFYNFQLEEVRSKDILTSNILFLTKQDGKYGYADKDGNIIINCIYDDATEFNMYGFASIKKDGKWGSINQEGKITCETKYVLDNNLKIDFIGKWHLGEDLNANYYTDE